MSVEMTHQSSTNATTPVLAAHNISKSFGPITALRDVSFEAHPGHVLALLGDNGAGKSTLIKVLSGVHSPTSGSLKVDGEEVKFSSAAEARAHGIATVFQDLAICPSMSIGRNIVLGNEPLRGVGPIKLVDNKMVKEIAESALSNLGVTLKARLRDPASSLSGGQRQSLAIARAVHYGSRCLILDEPTSALAVRQTRKVLDLVRQAADSGQAVILISHNLREAHEVADDIVALARGGVVGRFTRDETSPEELSRLISQT